MPFDVSTDGRHQLVIGALLTAVSFIVIFGTIVLFHELGHFAAAKAFGVRVFEFSVGIGPPLATLRRRETQYSIRMLPLGGFVKLAGMDPALRDEDEVAEEDAAQLQQPSPLAADAHHRRRALYEFPSRLSPDCGLLHDGSRSAHGDPCHAQFASSHGRLDAGDVIVAVDGQRTETAEDVIRTVQPNAGNPLTLSIRREKELIAARRHAAARP